MKILEVYPGFFTGNRIGGTERHIYDLCRCSLERGHKPIILSWDSSGEYFQESGRVLIHHFKVPKRFQARWYMKLFYLTLKITYWARKCKIDLIHAHDYLPGLAASLAGLFLFKPIVVTFHLPIWKTAPRLLKGSGPSFLLKKALKRYFTLRVSVIICVSNYTCRETIKLGFPSHKLKVIYNWATPTLKYEPPKPDYIQKKFGLNKRFILSVGGLVDKHKGFSMLIHALQILLNQGNDLDLVIVGKGPDKERLVQYCKKLGVENNVHFLGYVSDLDLTGLYRACDMVVQPSLVEGMSLVLIEAVAFGKLIVATRVGGTPEVLEDGLNGILVDPTPQSIASGIKKALLNPFLKERIIKRLGKCKKKFSVENCYTTIVLLEEVFKSWTKGHNRQSVHRDAVG